LGFAFVVEEGVGAPEEEEGAVQLGEEEEAKPEADQKNGCAQKDGKRVNIHASYDRRGRDDGGVAVDDTTPSSSRRRSNVL